jgi:hypothetical protein
MVTGVMDPEIVSVTRKLQDGRSSSGAGDGFLQRLLRGSEASRQKSLDGF